MFLQRIQDKCFLFKNDTNEFDKKKKVLFWLYQNAMLLLLGFILGTLSLYYARANETREIFFSYFKNFYILILNIAPVIVLLYFIYLLCGRVWIAFAAASAAVWGLSAANFYKLILRNDPIVFEDIVNVTTALKVVEEQNYNITPTPKLIIGALLLIALTVFAAFFIRGRLPLKLRFPLAIIPILISVSCWNFYTDSEIYSVKTLNIEHINRWAATQQYYSRGFIYPLLHSSVDFFVEPPHGYDEQKAAATISGYDNEDIPENEKVDIFFIQREAYSDLSLIDGIEGIDFSAYDIYHRLMTESYSGRLYTNIFAGGTVNSERSIMTGSYSLKNYRKNVNSYVHYLSNQGYTVEGSHPCYEWFYNRLNINQYLGFENYYFYENRYEAIVDDDVLYEDLIKIYEQRDTSKPYFNFSITYQGHGPYYSTWKQYKENSFVTGEYSDYSMYILENYLSSLQDSDKSLASLFDYFRKSDRPVIFCVYGDHKPWLGDNNSVYDELGINLDLSTQEGLTNYYATEYMIWANDAAKKAISFDFVGEGPDISPCYMMNLLFELCDWDGPAYMQLMDTFMKEMPVASTAGYYLFDGQFTSTLDKKHSELLAELRRYNYYWMNNFIY